MDLSTMPALQVMNSLAARIAPVGQPQRKSVRTLLTTKKPKKMPPGKALKKVDMQGQYGRDRSGLPPRDQSGKFVKK